MKKTQFYTVLMITGETKFVSKKAKRSNKTINDQVRIVTNLFLIDQTFIQGHTAH